MLQLNFRYVDLRLINDESLTLSPMLRNIIYMKRLLLIFVFITIVIFLIQPVDAISKLNTEGKYIKNEAGNIVFLRGINIEGYNYCPTGWWVPEGRYETWGETCRPNCSVETTTFTSCEWRPEAMRTNLENVSGTWGANVVRFHIDLTYWLNNTYNYRQVLKDTAQITEEYGIYVIYDLASIHHEFPWPPLPFRPYDPDSPVDRQGFVDFWINVSKELSPYSNIIFEVYNEPHDITLEEFYSVHQQVIDAIRNFSDNLIIVQYDYGMSYYNYGYGYCGLDWVKDYPINGTNIVYSQHIYRRFNHLGFDRPYNYDTIKQRMIDCGIPYPQENNFGPVFIGEIGANIWYTGTELDQELAYFNNTLTILNEWEMSYAGFEWWVGSGPIARWAGMLQGGNFIPPPNRAGQTLIDSIRVGGTIRLEAYPVNITGTVIDSETGLVISGAVVTCNTSSSTTNSSGWYFIRMPYTGSCSLTASKTGYVTKSVSINFPTNGTYAQYFALEPKKFKIGGGFVDKYNNPINANITAYQKNTTTIVNSTQTSNGNYSLLVLPAIYDIQYSIINFFIKLLSLTIASDISDIVNYLTSYDSKISFTTNISNEQIIQIYSDKKPTRVLLNGSEIGNVSSVATLKNNTYYYDSLNNLLYLKATPNTVLNKIFGKTDIGETGKDVLVNRITGSKFTLSESGTVTSMGIHIKAQSTAKIKLAIYGTSTESVLIGSTEEKVIDNTRNWETLSLTSPVNLSAGDYYLMVWTNATAYVNSTQVSPTVATWRNTSFTYDSFPTLVKFSGFDTVRFSIYANYTTT